MQDGDAKKEEAIRELLRLTRSLVAEGRNPLLLYIVDMALEELRLGGLDGANVAPIKPLKPS